MSLYTILKKSIPLLAVIEAFLGHHDIAAYVMSWAIYLRVSE